MNTDVCEPSSAADNPPARQPHRSSKIEARRRELAEATLETLAELGYARTSLREIAQKSAFTHGVLHYYFSDKVDLICCSVRHYKARCATRYDEVLTIDTRDELLELFLDTLAQTMRNDALVHRLWYDLRSQALFESSFRAEVAEIDASLETMIWRVACRYAELGKRQVALTKSAFYAAADGLFQRYLLKHLASLPGAVDDLVTDVRKLMQAVA